MDDIGLISEWVSRWVQKETEADITQVLKVAEHFTEDFLEAQEIIEKAREKKRCLPYMVTAFDVAKGYDDVEEDLTYYLERHIGNLKSKIENRCTKRKRE